MEKCEVTVKESLQQIQYIDKEIQKKVDKLSELRQLAYGGSIDYSAERVKSSGNQQRMASLVALIMDLEKEIDNEVDLLADYKARWHSELKKLKHEEDYNLLYDRYFLYRSLYKISKTENEDYSKVKKNHKKALKRLEKMIDKK